MQQGTQCATSKTDHTISHDHPSHINPLSIQQYSGGVKPLNKKQVSTILSAITGTYSSFSQEQQFEISNLVLQ